MTKATDPKLISFLVCDQVIQDTRTGKKSYVGVFDNINTPSVPCLHPELYVAIVLTNFRGKQNIILEMVFDASDGEKNILKLEGNFQSNDPLQMVDIVFDLKNLIFKGSGKYTLRIVSGDSGEIIASRPFTVTETGGAK